MYERELELNNKLFNLPGTYLKFRIHCESQNKLRDRRGDKLYSSFAHFILRLKLKQ